MVAPSRTTSGAANGARRGGVRAGRQARLNASGHWNTPAAAPWQGHDGHRQAAHTAPEHGRTSTYPAGARWTLCLSGARLRGGGRLRWTVHDKERSRTHAGNGPSGEDRAASWNTEWNRLIRSGVTTSARPDTVCDNSYASWCQPRDRPRISQPVTRRRDATPPAAQR